MIEPIWLGLNAVLVMHDDSLQLFGGSNGIRDQGLLESALARPKNIWSCEGPLPLLRLAAAYANGIIRNHPFVELSERTGFLAAYTFLSVNGRELEVSESEATLAVLSLTMGDISEEEFARWIDDHT